MSTPQKPKEWECVAPIAMLEANLQANASSPASDENNHKAVLLSPSSENNISKKLDGPQSKLELELNTMCTAIRGIVSN